MKTGKFNLFNAAYILRLIRDGEAKTWEEILGHFGLPDIKRVDRGNTGPLRMSFRTAGMNNIHSVLENILSNLIEADLVSVEKDYFLPTSSIEKVQKALDVSLSDLSKMKGDSVLANPFFGPPKPLYLTPDLVPDVFVLMPFAVELKPVYDDHIKVVAAEIGLSALRADDVFAASSIIEDVWSLICNSKIIIADCTGRNPNVFYEIGIAHTMGRPVILISQSMDDIPFDLRHIRCIIYHYTPRGMDSFNASLRRTLEAEIRKLQDNT